MKMFETAQNKIYIGCRELRIADESRGVSFPVLVQYPTLTASVAQRFGPYEMDVSLNAPLVEGERFPLVVISHGNNGSHLLYRTISLVLAKNGYIVAMPEHYGNNRNDGSLENTIENLELRPRHISLTIDRLLADDFFAGAIDEEKIAVIGHSMGGYTALALAGGQPFTLEGEMVAVEADARIGAIVLLAPGAGWFGHRENDIKIPILLVTAEHDPITPGWNAEIIFSAARDQSQITHREIANAGHYSFLSPFPAEMRRPGFLPATDPEGFDRAAFHEILPAEILGFLNDKLERN